MRASFLALGPLLARFGHARVSTPGGCAIGARPVDLHLAGLEKMGAQLAHRATATSRPTADAAARRAASLLDFPSVGATEQLMMAAALARGHDRDRERRARARDRLPRAALLSGMGATVTRRGHVATSTIEGRPELAGVDHAVIPDRIEAGTCMVAAAITGGDVRVRGRARRSPRGVRRQAARGRRGGRPRATSGIRVRRQRTRSRRSTSAPRRIPAFPTDLQAQIMALDDTRRGREHVHARRSSRTASCTRRSSCAWAPTSSVDGKYAPSCAARPSCRARP